MSWRGSWSGLDAVDCATSSGSPTCNQQQVTDRAHLMPGCHSPQPSVELVAASRFPSPANAPTLPLKELATDNDAGPIIARGPPPILWEEVSLPLPHPETCWQVPAVVLWLDPEDRLLAEGAYDSSSSDEDDVSDSSSGLAGAGADCGGGFGARSSNGSDPVLDTRGSVPEAPPAVAADATPPPAIAIGPDFGQRSSSDAPTAAANQVAIANSTVSSCPNSGRSCSSRQRCRALDYTATAEAARISDEAVCAGSAAGSINATFGVGAGGSSSSACGVTHSPGRGRTGGSSGSGGSEEADGLTEEEQFDYEAEEQQLPLKRRCLEGAAAAAAVAAASAALRPAGPSGAPGDNECLGMRRKMPALKQGPMLRPMLLPGTVREVAQPPPEVERPVSQRQEPGPQDWNISGVAGLACCGVRTPETMNVPHGNQPAGKDIRPPAESQLVPATRSPHPPPPPLLLSQLPAQPAGPADVDALASSPPKPPLTPSEQHPTQYLQKPFRSACTSLDFSFGFSHPHSAGARFALTAAAVAPPPPPPPPPPLAWAVAQHSMPAAAAPGGDYPMSALSSPPARRVQSSTSAATAATSCCCYCLSCSLDAGHSFGGDGGSRQAGGAAGICDDGAATATLKSALTTSAALASAEATSGSWMPQRVTEGSAAGSQGAGHDAAASPARGLPPPGRRSVPPCPGPGPLSNSPRCMAAAALEIPLQDQQQPVPCCCRLCSPGCTSVVTPPLLHHLPCQHQPYLLPCVPYLMHVRQSPPAATAAAAAAAMGKSAREHSAVLQDLVGLVGLRAAVEEAATATGLHSVTTCSSSPAPSPSPGPSPPHAQAQPQATALRTEQLPYHQVLDGCYRSIAATLPTQKQQQRYLFRRVCAAAAVAGSLHSCHPPHVCAPHNGLQRQQLQQPQQPLQPQQRRVGCSLAGRPPRRTMPQDVDPPQRPCKLRRQLDSSSLLEEAPSATSGDGSTQANTGAGQGRKPAQLRLGLASPIPNPNPSLSPSPSPSPMPNSPIVAGGRGGGVLMPRGTMGSSSENGTAAVPLMHAAGGPILPTPRSRSKTDIIGAQEPGDDTPERRQQQRQRQGTLAQVPPRVPSHGSSSGSAPASAFAPSSAKASGPGAWESGRDRAAEGEGGMQTEPAADGRLLLPPPLAVSATGAAAATTSVLSALSYQPPLPLQWSAGAQPTINGSGPDPLGAGQAAAPPQLPPRRHVPRGNRSPPSTSIALPIHHHIQVERSSPDPLQLCYRASCSPRLSGAPSASSSASCGVAATGGRGLRSRCCWCRHRSGGSGGAPRERPPLPLPLLHRFDPQGPQPPLPSTPPPPPPQQVFLAGSVPAVQPQGLPTVPVPLPQEKCHGTEYPVSGGGVQGRPDTVTAPTAAAVAPTASLLQQTPLRAGISPPLPLCSCPQCFARLPSPPPPAGSGPVRRPRSWHGARHDPSNF